MNKYISSAMDEFHILDLSSFFEMVVCFFQEYYCE